MQDQPKTVSSLPVRQDVGSDRAVLEQLMAMIRRQWQLAGLILIAALGCGMIVIQLQPQVYRSSAMVMVRQLPGTIRAESRPGDEEALFLSQMEIAKSADVAKLVAEKLDLANDKAFNTQPKSAFGAFLGRFQSDTVGGTDSLANVVQRMRGSVSVLRSGRTYVAAIAYDSADPKVAARVAQGLAEQFRNYVALGRPVSEVSILSPTTVPLQPVAPRKSFILMVAGILGAGFAIAIGGLREFSDRGLRNGSDMGEKLGLRFFGYLSDMGKSHALASPAAEGALRFDSLSRAALTAPFSAFGEVMRTIQVALRPKEIRLGGQTIGIISALPGEGKTTLAVNLAGYLASQGKKVLLLDADWRSAAASQWLAQDARIGVFDCLLLDKPLAAATLFDQTSNFTLLAADISDRIIEPAGLLMGPAMAKLIADSRQNYAITIIDLPALTLADTQAIEPLVDHFVLVGEWGRITDRAITETLNEVPEISSKIIGAVLNRVQPDKIALYSRAGSLAAFYKAPA